jgi:hypothetical protein
MTSADPEPGQHDDWIDAEDFLAFLRSTSTSYDVMREATQKDPAQLKLREAIARAGLQDRLW